MIGPTRWETFRSSIELYVKNLLISFLQAKLCGIEVLKSNLPILPLGNPVVSSESSDSYFPQLDTSSFTGEKEVAAQDPPLMSPHASSSITTADFDFDMNEYLNQDQNQGQGYSFTPSPQGNNYPAPMSNTPPTQSQAFVTPAQTQWDYQASNKTRIGGRGSGSSPYGSQGYVAHGYGSQGHGSQGQSSQGYGSQGYGTQSPSSHVSKPSQMVITSGYGYQPGYSQGPNPQDNM